MENHKFCPSCGFDLKKPITCPECNYPNEANSKFCQECGTPLSENVKLHTKKIDKAEFEIIEIEPVPKLGITIEFPYSTASFFEFAVKEAEKIQTYKKYGEGKNSLFRVTIGDKEMSKIADLLEQLKGWRKRAVYVNGTKVTWDSVFSYSWCYEKKKSCYKPDLYCFGYENAWTFNLWGCHQAGMPFTENATWFSYGKWLNNKGDWVFDKNRIQHELEKNLYDVRFCPAISYSLIEEIITALPNIINPKNNKNWKFMESFDLDIIGGLIMTTNQYGFDQQVAMIGVSPKGLGFMQEIKSRLKIKLPSDL